MQLLQAHRLDLPGAGDRLHGRAGAGERGDARHLGRDRGAPDLVAVGARSPPHGRVDDEYGDIGVDGSEKNTVIIWFAIDNVK